MWKLLAQERIVHSLPLDCGIRTVPWNYYRVAGQRQQFIVNRPQDLPSIAPWKIGAPDAVTKQGVACDQFALGWNPQTDAPWRVARRIQDVKIGTAQRQPIAFPRIGVDIGCRRRLH